MLVERCVLKTRALKPKMEEHASRSSAVQSVFYHHAVREGALISPSEVGFVRSTEPRSLDVESKDVQMEPSGEEFVFDMGQNTNSAVTKDARMELSKEECA